MIFNSVVIAKVNESNVINIKDISTNECLHYVESFNFTDEEIINLYQIDAENSRYLFTCYCYSKGESLIVKEILEEEKAKYHIIISREKF